jgi:tRNA-Thr(GGU) m(6)t(6)A37 methyltransferase TsaA
MLSVYDRTMKKARSKEKARSTEKKQPAAEIYGPLYRVGMIRSTLTSRHGAPRQGDEGAPDAWLDVRAPFAKALEGIAAGDEIVVVTWLHRAVRDVLKVRPRGDMARPLTGVFATRSPDRPNPIGLHPVTVKSIDGRRLRIGPIEAIDGTPVVDIKPVLCGPIR